MKVATQDYKHYFENRVLTQLTTGEIIYKHDLNHLEASKNHWIRLYDYIHRSF